MILLRCILSVVMVSLIVRIEHTDLSFNQIDRLCWIYFHSLIRSNLIRGVDMQLNFRLFAYGSKIWDWFSVTDKGQVLQSWHATWDFDQVHRRRRRRRGKNTQFYRWVLTRRRWSESRDFNGTLDGMRKYNVDGLLIEWAAIQIHHPQGFSRNDSYNSQLHYHVGYNIYIFLIFSSTHWSSQSHSRN